MGVPSHGAPPLLPPNAYSLLASPSVGVTHGVALPCMPCMPCAPPAYNPQQQLQVPAVPAGPMGGALPTRWRSSSNASAVSDELFEPRTPVPTPPPAIAATRPLPQTPPQATPSTSTVMASEGGLALPKEARASFASPQAVLLPHAQLPHGEQQKLPSPFWGSATGLPFSSALGSQACVLPVNASPCGMTSSALTSPGSSMLPSAVPSAIASAVPSERPSPALLPLPLGSSPAAAHLGPLPPAFLPVAATSSTTTSLFDTFSSGAACSAHTTSPLPSTAAAPLAREPAASYALPSCAPAAAASADGHACRSSGSSSSDGSSGDVAGAGLGGCLPSRFESFEARLDALSGKQRATEEGAKPDSTLRHVRSHNTLAIAKQLSVLFDDDVPGREHSEAEDDESAAEHAVGSNDGEDHPNLALSEASTAMLANQLAAVCLSPPRRDRAAGASSPTSRW